VDDPKSVAELKSTYNRLFGAIMNLLIDAVPTESASRVNPDSSTTTKLEPKDDFLTEDEVTVDLSANPTAPVKSNLRVVAGLNVAAGSILETKGVYDVIGVEPPVEGVEPPVEGVEPTVEGVEPTVEGVEPTVEESADHLDPMNVVKLIFLLDFPKPIRFFDRAVTVNRFPARTFFTVHFVVLFRAIQVALPTFTSVNSIGDLLLVLAFEKITRTFTLPLEEPLSTEIDTIKG